MPKPFAASASAAAALAPGAPTPTIHPAELERRVHLLGGNYQFQGLPSGPTRPILAGMFHTEQLRPGLLLQRTRVTDLVDLKTSLTLQPAVKLALVVEGSCDITLGSLRLRLGPHSSHTRKSPDLAALVALAQPERFTRHWHRGRSEAKVTLTLTSPWFDAGGLDDGPELDALLNRPAF